MKPTREQLTHKSRLLTQSLFLELGYGEKALYTMKDYDHVHKGTAYPSLKKLYLEMEDTTEFEFANKYFLGWNHWKRLCNNEQIRPLIEEMREELELKLRAVGVRQAIDLASTGNFQAAKWLNDKGFLEKRTAGRPTKDEVEGEKVKQAKILDEFEDDFKLLNLVER